MALQLPATGSHPQDFDKATQSNYTQIVVRHTHLEWTIDWKKQIFHGHALLSLKALNDDVKHVALDTSYLDIKTVEVEDKEVKWTVGDRIGTIGSALSFDLPKKVSKGEVRTTTRVPLVNQRQLSRLKLPTKPNRTDFRSSKSRSPTLLPQTVPPSDGSTRNKPNLANGHTSILSLKRYV